MKTYWKRIGSLLLALALLLSIAGCGQSQEEEKQGLLPAEQTKHTYRMDLSLNEENKTLTGQMTVSYRNATGKILQEIPFMVYPNAFLNQSTAPFDEENIRGVYPNGFSSGGITITHLSVDGVNTTYELGNEDSTLLTVDLPVALAADGTAEIAFEFTVQLPNSLGRFGYGDKTFNLCNFYPIACAYDGTQFLTYPYYTRGDPFVSDMADYEVTLSVPADMKVAHSGTSIVATGTERAIYNVTATNVRDFAAVCSRYFAVSSKKVQSGGTDTVVYTYTMEGSFGQDESLEAAANAVKAYSELVGPYPYPTFSVVETDFFIGGMEYPNIVLIDKSLYEDTQAYWLEYVIAHEVGHQWFYGVVGSDQVMEPWLDEALTEYLTLCYYGYTYDEQAQQTHFEQFVEFSYMFCDISGYIPEGQDRVGLPVTSYDTDYAYSAVVYSRGTMMMDSLADEIGQDKLFDALGVYFTTCAGKRATKEDLLRILDEQTGYDCTSFINEWL